MIVKRVTYFRVDVSEWYPVISETWLFLVEILHTAIEMIPRAVQDETYTALPQDS